MIVRADAARLPFADRTFDLVIGSPPYEDSRLYLENGQDLGIARECHEWVVWMLGVTAEALRVSKGLVLWVVCGKTEDRCYHPAPEGLLWKWWEKGQECHCLRPVIWHRNGICGSGGDQWFRADCEYVMAFKRPGLLPWADNKANGHAPKLAPGGEMSYGVSRTVNGGRQKPGRPSHQDPSPRRANGCRESQSYANPDVANPGNFFHTRSGGGQMGSPLAHQNEAPFPVAVPKWFIASHCPPGGIVLDPFAGSGTTIDAALSLGRRGVGCDLRQSQCRLSLKRIRTVTPGFVFRDPEGS